MKPTSERTSTISREFVEAAVNEQRIYFQTRSLRTLSVRLEALARLEKYIREERETLLEALREDLGKPPLEAFLAEYHFLLEELKLVRRSLKSWWKPKKVSSPAYFWPCSAQVQREAYGVVLVVAPWNYPIQLSLSPLIAAIAAGNTVILKPSEMAPASEAWLVRTIDECFSPEHVGVITGGRDVSEILLDQKFDFIFFTGSTRVGRIVAEKAAQNLTPCVLELGGKCPCIVDASADLKVAARRILLGKFFNAGQTCFAPDFVAVEASAKEGFVRECAELLNTVPWADEMANCIHEAQYQRLLGLLRGVAESEVITGGGDRPESYFLAPRILPNAKWTDSIMQEEVFGAILPVVTFIDENELIESLRQYGSPLACYVFSQRQEFVEQMMRSVVSGAVCVNDTMKQSSHLGLPFGGVGESGYGRYRGRAGVETMSYERSVLKRPTWAPQAMDLLPPYQKSYERLKKWMK